MPMTFPSHQGLILPVVRRWPNSFDALALSVGAAMPDVVDTLLGLSINGYFKHWVGHSLLGTVTVDLAGGLFLTWMIAILARRLFASAKTPYYVRAFLPTAPTRLGVWSFSVLVGILSHIFFDLISHDTNMALYPWYENPHAFPEWWYTIWVHVPAMTGTGRTYGVGIFTVLWGLLTVLGIFMFFQFLYQTKKEQTVPGSNSMDSEEDRSSTLH